MRRLEHPEAVIVGRRMKEERRHARRAELLAIKRSRYVIRHVFLPADQG
jgi:hypothetical protein